NYSAPTYSNAGNPALTIDLKATTASVASTNKTFGTNDPALPAVTNLTGLVNANVTNWNNATTAINDSALTSSASALTRTAGEAVGSYNVTAGTFSAPSSNYSAPTYSNAGNPALTIDLKATTASVASTNKTFGTNDPALPAVTNLTG